MREAVAPDGAPVVLYARHFAVEHLSLTKRFAEWHEVVFAVVSE